jgi:hypothetical protein
MVTHSQIKSWSNAVGFNRALVLLMERTGYSASTIEKLLRDKYPSKLNPFVMKEIESLIHKRKKA